jgi:hypothetical protein
VSGAPSSYALVVSRGGVFIVASLIACGARTELRGELKDASAPADAGVDVADVTQPDVDQPDVPSGPCTLGPFIDLPASDCGGDQVDWFATPYTPPVDISVDRIEAHMAQGNVALLESTGGAPGAVIFIGNAGTSPMKAWIGTDVSPPVSLSGGTQYFIGFQGDCSFTFNGSEPIEYIASSVNGPWHDQGTDNWTARLIGTCK